MRFRSHILLWLLLLIAEASALSNDTDSVASGGDEGISESSGLTVADFDELRNTSDSTDDEEPDSPKLYGMRVEDNLNHAAYPHVATVRRDEQSNFAIFGRNLRKITKLWLTNDGMCHFLHSASSKIVDLSFSVSNTTAYYLHASGVVPDSLLPYRLCSEPHGFFNTSIVPRDFLMFLTVSDDSLLMPIYIQIPLLLLLILMSCLFSGLNVGLMALSVDDLLLIEMHSDSDEEKRYARNILPLRRNGNFLLCSLLIGNQLVNNLMTLLLNNIVATYFTFSPLVTVVISLIVPTLIIVVIGEIVPQAVCSKYGLKIGSMTSYFTIFFMTLTSPISYPLSVLLDKIVGVEGRDVYDNRKIAALVKMQRDLNARKQQQQRKKTDQYNVEHAMDGDTAEMVLGAMNLSLQRVGHIMTRIEACFMLPDDTLIDKELVRKISEVGHTRIPIYENGDRNQITDILNIKDLIPIDPDGTVTVGTVAKLWFRGRHFRYVLADLTLMQLMKDMKHGYPLALVMQFDDSSRDYRIIGLVTLEDVVEEVIGDIMDEKDAMCKTMTRLSTSQWRSKSKSFSEEHKKV